jgi:hypothetical protein
MLTIAGSGQCHNQISGGQPPAVASCKLGPHFATVLGMRRHRRRDGPVRLRLAGAHGPISATLRDSEAAMGGCFTRGRHDARRHRQACPDSDCAPPGSRRQVAPH